MSVRATPPSVYCEDFALIPRGAHAGKPRVAFGRPVNLLSAASAGNGAQAPGEGAAAAHVLVLNLDGQLYVRDLTGSAALQWNGRTVVEASLRHADRVRLGKIEYEVFATRMAPTAAAAAANGQTPVPTAELSPAVGGGEARPVSGPVTLVGASEQAELRLLAAGAPEACAMILRLGAGYWLWNLDPTSPCRVNGEAVVRSALADGSVVTIGDQDFRFRILPQGDAPKAPVSKPKPSAPTVGQAPATPLKAPVQATTTEKKVAAKVPAAKALPAPSPVPAPAQVQAPAHAAAPTPARAPVPAPLSVPTPAPALPPAASTPAPVPLPDRTVAPAAGLSPISLPTKRTPSASALYDDAEVFEQWGPLAFAVAAADRPELQAGGARSGTAGAPATDATPAPRGRFFLRLLGVLVPLALLAAGAFFAWKYWKR